MMQSPPPLSSDVALFLDFDGTLTDIAPTPDAVRVAEDLTCVLQAAAWGLNGALAIVSGRPIAVIDRYLDGAIPAVTGIGGAERRTSAGQLYRAVLDNTLLDPARSALGRFARAHSGVLLEDKTASVVLHYRQAPHLAEDCHHLVARCAADSHGRLEKIGTSMAAELRPVGIRKGAAVLAFMNEPPFAGRRPVFVGDDPIDEDAFAEVNRTNGYSVIVGDRADTAATHRFANVGALHDWLRDFAELVQDGTNADRPPRLGYAERHA